MGLPSGRVGLKFRADGAAGPVYAGFKKPPAQIVKKSYTISTTDPDCGYINHGNKCGIGYLMEATVDCKHGILTGVDVYAANQKESLLVLRHLERQIQYGVPMKQIALDRGYDTGAVHRRLELLGITGYIPAIQFSNSPEKYGFFYAQQEDTLKYSTSVWFLSTGPNLDTTGVSGFIEIARLIYYGE